MQGQHHPRTLIARRSSVSQHPYCCKQLAQHIIPSSISPNPVSLAASSQSSNNCIRKLFPIHPHAAPPDSEVKVPLLSEHGIIIPSKETKQEPTDQPTS